MANAFGDNPTREYDLEERTACFAEDVIRFAKSLPLTAVTRRLIDQLVGASSSIGANYCEANEAESRPAFRVRIATCRKEAKEARLFLRLIATAVEDRKADARTLWKEADELLRIFAAAYRNSATE